MGWVFLQRLQLSCSFLEVSPLTGAVERLGGRFGGCWGRLVAGYQFKQSPEKLCDQGTKTHTQRKFKCTKMEKKKKTYFRGGRPRSKVTNEI